MALPLQTEKFAAEETGFLINNLRTLLHRDAINEAKLSRDTGIPQPTIHKILAGKTSDPRLSTLQILAKHFNVTLDALCSDYMLPTQEKLIVGTIPILSWEECLELKTWKTGSSSRKYVCFETPETQDVFALTSKPSMDPPFSQGTLLIVDSKRNPSDGNLVIVHYQGCKEATLRRLLMDGPDRQLLSLGQIVKSDFLTETIRIVGIVIQTRFNYFTE